MAEQRAPRPSQSVGRAGTPGAPPAAESSARLARRRDGFGSLSGGGFGRRGADRGIGSPAIGEDLPRAGGLFDENDQIFSALFAALSHGDGHEHLAAAEIERDIEMCIRDRSRVVHGAVVCKL